MNKPNHEYDGIVLGVGSCCIIGVFISIFTASGALLICSLISTIIVPYVLVMARKDKKTESTRRADERVHKD